jgi:hypothetical protein
MGEAGRTAIVCSFVLCLCSCNEDATHSVVSPPAPDPAGEWTVTRTEISDSCNLISSTLVNDWQISPSGDQFDVQREGSSCNPRRSIYYYAGGMGFTPISAYRTSPNGCEYHVESNLSIRITQDEVLEGTLSETARLVYGYPSYGTCDARCTVAARYHGERCDDCYEGCL